MAELVWDQIGDRSYELGVSKGVLYQENRIGVPWNGLTSIEEANTNSVESIYFDGVKFADIVTIGEYAATLRAFTYPDEFLYCEGVVEDQTGFYITNQMPGMFCLSYQTKIGDDVSGVDGGYKIHILYNLTAVPSNRSFETIGDSLDPIEFEWNITSIPEDIAYFHPTSHVIFDSTKIDPQMFKDIESILYGSDTTDPYLPSLKGLSSFIRKWQRLIITDNGDGTWTADAKDEGVINMLDAITFEMTTDTATYLNANTYEITSSEKNEEDVWLP